LANNSTRSGVGGGPTASGGFNYQAAVTAITMAHAASGAPLHWLEGVAYDAPTAVAAESGGGGDDIRLSFADGTFAEIQVKSGLQAGQALWDALDGLAQAVESGQAHYGLLVVSPSSSGTIRNALAEDLVKLGEGSPPGGGGMGLPTI
jgi:hypothetical protein